VARELRIGRAARRRILIELDDHIDDAVDDLRSSGLPREEAMEEALKRFGDAQSLANAFAAARTRSAGSSRLRGRHSLAWIAVAAMSVVTAWAAELPQASGAKPPAKVLAPASRRVGPAKHPTIRRQVRRAPIVAHPRRGSRADRGY
jgi:hypothetical protein